LISAALALPDAQPDRAGYLDELAHAYEKLGRFEDAIDAMRRAVAAGWDGELDDHPSAQALIADLLLRLGRDREADDAWAQAERDDPRNPWVHSAASDAYTRAGLQREALPRQTKGLELALAAGDDEPEIAEYLTGERGRTLDVLGLPPDELQLQAEELIERDEQQDRAAERELLRRFNEPRPLSPQQTHIGAEWFPADQYQRALQTWPSFAEDYATGALRGVLRTTRTDAPPPQSQRRQTPLAHPDPDRRAPRLVHPTRPRSPAIRHPGKLLHHPPRTRHRRALAAATKRALLVWQRTQVQEVLRPGPRAMNHGPHPGSRHRRQIKRTSRNSSYRQW
jgi:hypothetical protein